MQQDNIEYTSGGQRDMNTYVNAEMILDERVVRNDLISKEQFESLVGIISDVRIKDYEFIKAFILKLNNR